MRILPSLALVAAVAALGACEQPSRLDKVTSKAPAPGATAPGQKAEAPAGLKIDRSGSVEQQLARLQDAYDRNAEAVEFLNKVFAQQKAQQAAQEREEPADDAVFAVDIAPDLKLGQVEGPSTALVTIVEAWDFA
jgi:DNA segregation ATPase FtsK/SpoIIIE-like protein